MATFCKKIRPPLVYSRMAWGRAILIIMYYFSLHAYCKIIMFCVCAFVTQVYKVMLFFWAVQGDQSFIRSFRAFSAQFFPTFRLVQLTSRACMGYWLRFWKGWYYCSTSGVPLHKVERGYRRWRKEINDTGCQHPHLIGASSVSVRQIWSIWLLQSYHSEVGGGPFFILLELRMMGDEGRRAGICIATVLYTDESLPWRNAYNKAGSTIDFNKNRYLLSHCMLHSCKFDLIQ